MKDIASNLISLYGCILEKKNLDSLIANSKLIIRLENYI